MAIKNHYRILNESYNFKNKTIDLIFYTNDSKVNNNAAAALILVTSKTQIVSQLQLATNSVVIDQKSQILDYNWNLNQIDIVNAEILAIEKATFWILKLVRRFNIRKTITIFLDSILTLKAISKTRSQTLHIHENISYAKELNYLIKLHWIFSHQNISGNDLVDNLAKKGHNLAKI